MPTERVRGAQAAFFQRMRELAGVHEVDLVHLRESMTVQVLQHRSERPQLLFARLVWAELEDNGAHLWHACAPEVPSDPSQYRTQAAGLFMFLSVSHDGVRVLDEGSARAVRQS